MIHPIPYPPVASRRHSITSLIAVLAVGLLVPSQLHADSEPVFLRDTSETPKKSEGILLWIDSKGGLFSDSGPTSEKKLQETFKQWRDQGTEPGIRLILYPSLKSNSDLKAMRRVIDLLRANKVGYDIMLQPIDAIPEKDLIQD